MPFGHAARRQKILRLLQNTWVTRNIAVTQNIFARAGGTNEWMRDMVGGRENANC